MEKFCNDISGKGTTGTTLENDTHSGKEMWSKVLGDLTDVTLFLEKQTLPFWGSHSTLDHDDYGLFLSRVKKEQYWVNFG